MQLTPEQMGQIKAQFASEWEKLASQPLVVSIMGQTGVGKSSLINALFNTNFKTDPTRPCTKEIESVTIRGKGDRRITFNDMPGIGESEHADAAYLVKYREYLHKSDVVLWAIHSDNRSIAFDKQALATLLSGLDAPEQSVLISHITFILTKVDVLGTPPWILLDAGKYSVFTPDDAVENILREKERYYQEAFIEPYGSLIVSHTYNDVSFAINDSSFTSTQYSVYYKGMLSRQRLAELKGRHPKYTEMFERLYDNYCVVPCSSNFKYNLTRLLLVILNKLGPEAIARFRHFVDANTLDQVPTDWVRHMCNMVIFDQHSRRKVFDLSDGTFPKQGRN